MEKGREQEMERENKTEIKIEREVARVQAGLKARNPDVPVND